MDEAAATPVLESMSAVLQRLRVRAETATPSIYQVNADSTDEGMELYRRMKQKINVTTEKTWIRQSSRHRVVDVFAAEQFTGCRMSARLRSRGLKCHGVAVANAGGSKECQVKRRRRAENTKSSCRMAQRAFR